MIIHAVVVTYNRLELLKCCLEKLFAQTYGLNRIIVVNNASTDGTKEYLKLISKDPRMVVINLKKNLGGAGGFYHGVKRAYELGCDHIWLMDDDTMPEPNALEELIRGLDHIGAEKVGFLGSNVLYKDGSPCIMNISRAVKRWNDHFADGLVEVFHSSFVSMLIPSAVVEKVGLPIREYFIWGDDAEYSTRIIRAGYPGFMVSGSTVYHYMSENAGIDIFTASPERLDRFYYFYRNITTTDRLRGLRTFIPRLMYHAFIVLKILFSKTDHKLKKSAVVIKGTVAGMFKKVRIEAVKKRDVTFKTFRENKEKE